MMMDDRTPIPARIMVNRLVPAVAMVMTMTGCSDPKAASTENFQKALTAFFDRNCEMLTAVRYPPVFPDGPPFPASVGIVPLSDSNLRHP